METARRYTGNRGTRAPMRAFFVCVALFASFLAACGGSSSETPPPLEPDPHDHYRASRITAPEASSASPAKPAGDEADDDDDVPRKPARSTWGGAEKPKPNGLK